MAEQVTIFEVDISIDKVVKDIETSKKAIAGLQDAISDLSKAEEQDTAAIIQATAALKAEQSELRKNETLTKNMIIAKQGEGKSIESLRAALSVVSTQWAQYTDEELLNLDAAKKLNAQKLELTETLKKVEKATGDHRREVGNYAIGVQGLKKELKDLKTILLTAQEGTDEYNQALKRSAQITDDLGDMQERVKGTALGLEDVMRNANTVISGVANAYQALQGAQALLGIENEDLQKSLVKIQAAMAIAQGLEGMEGMAKASRNLITQLKATAVGQKVVTAAQWLWNAAMSANPIGLLVAGLAALGAAIYGLVKYFEASEAAILKQNTAMDGLVLNSKEAVAAHNEHIKVMTELDQQLSVTTGKITEFEKSVIDMVETYNEQIAEIRKSTDEDAEKTGGFWNTLYNTIKSGGNIVAGQLATNLEIAGKIVDSEQAIADKTEELNIQITKIKEEEDKKRTENQKKANEERLQLAKEERLQLAKEQDEKELKIAEENIQKDLARLKNRNEALRQEALAAAEALEIELAAIQSNDEFDKQLADFKAEKRQIESDAKFAAAKDDIFRTLDLERSALEEKYQQEITFANNLGAETTAIEEKYSQARKEITITEQNAKLALMSNVAGAIISLAGEGTAAGKAAAIAQTTISTYVAAQAAFAGITASTGGWGIAAAIAAAAGAVAFGIANVKKILAVPTPGGGSGGGSIPTPSSGGGGGSTPNRPLSFAPNVNQGIVSRQSNNTVNNAMIVQPTLIIDDVTNNQNRKAANGRTSVI